jgi:hypothetical protein
MKTNKSEILATGIWAASDVKVSIKGNYSPTQNLQKYINGEWNNLVKKFPQIYNGPMLGLVTWEVRENALMLVAQKTDYASYLATRPPNFSERFLQEQRADPIGMNIVSITLDRKLIVTCRSLESEQNPGTLNFIGGYIDPPSDPKILKVDVESQAKRELKEELNVDESKVREIIVCGLGYDPFYCHPELFLVAILEKTSREILDEWSLARDAKEAYQVMTIEKETLLAQYHTNSLPYPTCWSFEIGLKLLPQ